MTETQILITIKQSKPTKTLLDKAAGRIYTMDGVEDVTATLLSPEKVRLAMRNQSKPIGLSPLKQPPEQVEQLQEKEQ